MNGIIAACGFLVFIQLVSFTTQTDNDSLWNAYKKKFSKQYTKDEEWTRRVIWESNLKNIQRHNVEADLGSHSFSEGINEYSDLTIEEYKKYLLGAKPPKTRKYKSNGLYKRKLKDLPKTVDWRQQGYVTPIKNQGQCGSCWAFSTTGCLEGQHFKKTGYLVSLSEQNLVDCVKENGGCNGGWMDKAYHYIEMNGGIDTENSYPYEARDDTCRYNKQSKGAQDYGFMDIARGDETTLKAAVAEIGPISVAIDANHESFMNYRQGVYHEPQCSNITVDHAVLVVGYGTYYGQDYWLVKNSWGTSWGTNGYIKMARNKKNNCGIASYASIPMV